MLSDDDGVCVMALKSFNFLYATSPSPHPHFTLTSSHLTLTSSVPHPHIICTSPHDSCPPHLFTSSVHSLKANFPLITYEHSSLNQQRYQLLSMSHDTVCYYTSAVVNLVITDMQINCTPAYAPLPLPPPLNDRHMPLVSHTHAHI